jgi:hypothetical protein
VVWANLFLAAFVVMLGVGNVQVVRAGRRLAAGADERERMGRADVLVVHGRAEEAYDLVRGVDHPAARVIGAMALLRLGRPREAQDLLLDLPGFVTLDPTFEATVLLANGQERLAREKLLVALGDHPEPWAVRELAVLLRSRGEDTEAALPGVGGAAAAAVQVGLFHVGEFAASARWGERALGSGVDDPLVAFNTACGWARAGDLDKALRALDHAALLGLADAETVDADPDLDALRHHPGFAAVRERIGSRDPRARR